MTPTLEALVIPGLREHNSFTEEIYVNHKSLIESLAYRYHSYHLDPAFEKDDYRQLAYLGVSDAAAKWQFHRGQARFGSVLFNYIRKQYQSHVTGINKLVEITNRSGVIVDILTYSVYQKKRKDLESQGFSGTPFDRLVPLEDYHQLNDFPEIDSYAFQSDERIAIGL